MAQTVIPYLLYEDANRALEWLSEAFGFEETMRMTGDDGRVNHAEMALGDGQIYLGGPGGDYRGPAEVGRTVLMYVLVPDVDAHHERAKAAGAEVVDEPEDQEYGDRRYAANDPEGHRWYFAQRMR